MLEVRRDPNRSAHIALVAGSRGKRWIIASENMTAGQIIGTSEYIGENPIVGIEGYAHPLGALSIGTFVHCIEKYPGTGGSFIVEAGAAAEIIRPHGEYVVLRVCFWSKVCLTIIFSSDAIQTRICISSYMCRYDRSCIECTNASGYMGIGADASSIRLYDVKWIVS